MLWRNLGTTQRELMQIKKVLVTSGRDRDRQAPFGYDDIWKLDNELDHSYWKAFDHCATVVRAYATFERFVLNVVEQWVHWCLLYRPEIILKSETARSLYEAGLAEILRRKTETRFVDLDRGHLA